MKWNMFALSRRWLVVPPLLLGVAVAAWLIFNRKGPNHMPEREEVRAVRVIEITPVDMVPRALGYGTAKPSQVWRAISEVQGRTQEVHPQLKPGAMIKKGEVLLRIDPTEYELAIAKIEADMAQVDSQLEELVVKQTNDRTSLEIEKESLTLVQRDLHRGQRLIKTKAISESEIDQQERNVLAQRQIVQRLQNSLRLVPQQKKSLEAILEVRKASLAQAKLNLAKTIIRAPFKCRLGEVEIEPGQFLIAGQSLFRAYGTACTEVETQIPLDHLRALIDPERAVQFPINMDAKMVQTLFDFRVTVRFRSSDFQAKWEARVVRMREQLDPRTRTVGLVVAVDKPYEKAIPGLRPPLVQGMYCEVELRGKVQPSQIVIPRSAFYHEQVYVVGADNRMHRRKVEVAFVQSNLLCLRNGLQAGERLIVSDPTPAIEGLLTDPVVDERLQQRLRSEAIGEGSLK